MTLFAIGTMNDQKIKLIYVLGNSHSGSTIFSMFIGRHPEIFFFGEIKRLNISRVTKYCTCGRKPNECDYWGPFIEKNPAIFKRPQESNQGLYRLFSTFRSMLSPVDQATIQFEKKLIQDLTEYTKSNFLNTKVYLDSSKSLKRFIMLRQMENMEIYPLYIDRGIRSSLGSFVRRKKGFINNYFRLKFNKRLIKNYLKKHKVSHLKFNYEDFVQDPEVVRNQVLKFIGFDEEKFDERPLSDIHQISGNSTARLGYRQEQKIAFRNTNEEPFSAIQKFLLNVLGL